MHIHAGTGVNILGRVCLHIQGKVCHSLESPVPLNWLLNLFLADAVHKESAVIKHQTTVGTFLPETFLPVFTPSIK